jgi:hypothetical protein
VDANNARQHRADEDLNCSTTLPKVSLALNTCALSNQDMYRVRIDLLGIRYGEKMSYLLSQAM